MSPMSPLGFEHPVTCAAVPPWPQQGGGEFAQGTKRRRQYTQWKLHSLFLAELLCVQEAFIGLGDTGAIGDRPSKFLEMNDIAVTQLREQGFPLGGGTGDSTPKVMTAPPA